jgi:hypothetical protein
MEVIYKGLNAGTGKVALEMKGTNCAVVKGATIYSHIGNIFNETLFLAPGDSADNDAHFILHAVNS